MGKQVPKLVPFGFARKPPLGDVQLARHPCLIEENHADRFSFFR